MKAQWALLLEKLDALSLRERMILFLTVLFCIGALVQLLWLAPVLTKQKKLEQEAATQTAEAARLRDEIKAAAVAVDPSQVVRDEVANSQKRMDALNQELNVLLPRAQNGPALEQVLVQFLRRYEGLTLLSVKTLADGGTAGLPPGLTKRGIELRVTGPYAALVAYVQNLETALPALRWGSMVLKSEAQPPELTLQVFVLGVQPI